MKLRDVQKGTRAVTRVTFRLANAPIPERWKPGEAVPKDDYTVVAGARVLTGQEISDAYEKARAAAFAAGVTQWLDTDPLCRLYEMAHTLLVAYVDIDNPVEPFFSSIDELMKAPEIGRDNIAYLYEQHGVWQDACSLKTTNLSAAEVLGMLIFEASQPENAGESPLVRMPRATLESCMRTTAHMFVRLLRGKSATTSDSDSSSTSDLLEQVESPQAETPTDG